MRLDLRQLGLATPSRVRNNVTSGMRHLALLRLSLRVVRGTYPTMTMPNSPGTLLELLDPVPGERTAILLPEDGTQVSYASLREQVKDVADAFAGLGIGRGDRVAMALPNGLPVIVCFLGAAGAGTAAPLNPGYREDEFRFYLEDTEARLLVLPEDGGEDARRAAGDSVAIAA